MTDRVDHESLRVLIEARTTSDAPLDRLTAAVVVTDELRDAGDAVLDHFVTTARGDGCSWAQIGAVLGVSKQAAQQRFAAPPATAGAWPQGVTASVRKAVSAAQDHARRLGHDHLGTEHLLVGLLTLHDGPASRALANLGVTAAAVLAHTREVVGLGCAPSGASITVTPRAKRALELAQAEARRRAAGADADAEHLLLALVRLEDGLAAKLLRRLGASPQEVRQQLANELGVDASELAPLRRRRTRVLQRR